MGGAVGMAARKAGVATRVTGVADRPETIQKAKLLGAVDEATLDLREGVREADLVLLAVPVRLIPEVAQAVIPACREGAVITDLGSAKASVVAAVESQIARMKAPVHFIGSHPIAGSEKAGIEAAHEVVFSGAKCVITYSQGTDGESYHLVDDFWKALGMKTLRLSPEDHDAFLARSSHLPHLLSFALVQTQSARSLELSGPGLRDMTRLAGSDLALWTDVFSQNAEELAKALKEFLQEVRALEKEIEALRDSGSPGAEAARERLFRYLADARQRHDQRFTELLPSREAPRASAYADDPRSRDTQIAPLDRAL